MKKLIVLSLALISAVSMHNAYAMEGTPPKKEGKEEIPEVPQPKRGQRPAQEILRSLEMIDPMLFGIIQKLPPKESEQMLKLFSLMLLETRQELREETPGIQVTASGIEEGLIDKLRKVAAEISAPVREAKKLKKSVKLIIDNQTDKKYMLDIFVDTEISSGNWESYQEQSLGDLNPQSKATFIVPLLGEDGKKREGEWRVAFTRDGKYFFGNLYLNLEKGVSMLGHTVQKSFFAAQFSAERARIRCVRTMYMYRNPEEVSEVEQFTVRLILKEGTCEIIIEGVEKFE